MKDATVTASQKVDNDPHEALIDGILNAGYGPVFANGVQLGIYKVDLGAAKPVSSISSWSFNQNGNRGRQFVTIYGSNDETDPGWNVKDAKKFTPARQHRHRLAARRQVHRRLAARTGRLILGHLPLDCLGNLPPKTPMGKTPPSRSCPWKPISENL